MAPAFKKHSIKLQSEKRRLFGEIEEVIQRWLFGENEA